MRTVPPLFWGSVLNYVRLIQNKLVNLIGFPYQLVNRANHFMISMGRFGLCLEGYFSF